jgi:hypothetical protein
MSVQAPWKSAPEISCDQQARVRMASECSRRDQDLRRQVANARCPFVQSSENADADRRRSQDRHIRYGCSYRIAMQ